MYIGMVHKIEKSSMYAEIEEYKQVRIILFVKRYNRYEQKKLKKPYIISIFFHKIVYQKNIYIIST